MLGFLEAMESLLFQGDHQQLALRPLRPNRDNPVDFPNPRQFATGRAEATISEKATEPSGESRNQSLPSEEYFYISRIVETNLDSPGAVAALASLAQEHRLALFRMLVQAGPDGMAAGALAQALGVPNSSLSFHLAQLTRAGLIGQRREGRSLIYTANYDAMNALVGFLTENCCGGADCSPASLAPQSKGSPHDPR